MASHCEYPGCKEASTHNVVHPKTGVTFETCERHKEAIIKMITTRRKKKKIFLQKRLDSEDYWD